MDLTKSIEYFDPVKVRGKCHIIGCGSVGSTVAENLARLGVTNFVLYDFDIVEPHNLANQMFVQSDVKKPKVGIVGEILVKFLPAANNYLVDLLEAEGAEAVCPDLLDFMFYCFYNQIYKAEHLGTSKKTARTLLPRHLKQASTLIHQQIFTTPWNMQKRLYPLEIRLVKAGS